MFLENGKPLSLKPLPVGKFRGTRLPGADLEGTEQEDYAVYHHFYQSQLFDFSLFTLISRQQQLIQFRFARKIHRLIAMLTGGWQDKDGAVRLLPGQYRITYNQATEATIEANRSTELLMLHLKPEFISQIPMSEELQPSMVKTLSDPMRSIITKMLRNPFEEVFRQGLYDYSLRELLFCHLALPPVVLPGEMKESDVALAYAADRIIAANLDKHYTIHELARMVNTNVFTLKTAFTRLFHMGTFERLQKLKMEQAIYLLERTDEQIQSVAFLSGYETVTGFINSFRYQYGMTPREWRNKSRQNKDKNWEIE